MWRSAFGDKYVHSIPRGDSVRRIRPARSLGPCPGASPHPRKRSPCGRTIPFRSSIWVNGGLRERREPPETAPKSSRECRRYSLERRALEGCGLRHQRFQHLENHELNGVAATDVELLLRTRGLALCRRRSDWYGSGKISLRSSPCDPAEPMPQHAPSSALSSQSNRHVTETCATTVQQLGEVDARPQILVGAIR